MTTKDSQVNNTPTIFNFENHEVRTINEDPDNPQFVAKDVCDILNIKQPIRAIEQINERLKEAGLNSVISNHSVVKDSIGRNKKMLTINEQKTTSFNSSLCIFNVC